MTKQIDIEEWLAKSPKERVTVESISSRITDKKFITVDTHTLCILTLDNGFRVIGESACVNPENFNKDVGESLSFQQAFNKLWPFFGFLLAEKNFTNGTR